MSKQQTYTVLSPLLRNGEAHEPGAQVKMPPEEAEALVAAGVLAEVEPLPTDDDGATENDAGQPAADNDEQKKAGQKKAGQKKGDGQ